MRWGWLPCNWNSITHVYSFVVHYCQLPITVGWMDGWICGEAGEECKMKKKINLRKLIRNMIIHIRGEREVWSGGEYYSSSYTHKKMSSSKQQQRSYNRVTNENLIGRTWHEHPSEAKSQDRSNNLDGAIIAKNRWHVLCCSVWWLTSAVVISKLVALYRLANINLRHTTTKHSQNLLIDYRVFAAPYRTFSQLSTEAWMCQCV